MSRISRLSRILNATTIPLAPPAKPQTTPKTPPKPAPTPFNPPMPEKLPEPKAQTRLIKASWEEGVHPGIQNFWSTLRGSQHRLGKHPLMAMYGEETSKRSYQQNIDRLRKVFPNLANASDKQIADQVPRLSQSVFMKLHQLEGRYKSQLEEIAKNVVSQVWGVPKDILNAQLTQNTTVDAPQEDEKHKTIDKGLQEQVNKRITLNTMTHGAAVHSMMSVHHLVDDAINKLDPNLLKFYDQFSAGSLHSYWLVNFAEMANFGNMSIGTSKVDYKNGKGMVIAKAFVFPVLVQELVKGVMELISHHGLEGIPQGQLGQIYKEADSYRNEPWLIQVGPQLWRDFLKIIPKGSNLAETVMILAKQDPKYIHDLLSKVIENQENPEEAKTLLLQAIEQFKQQHEPGS